MIVCKIVLENPEANQTIFECSLDDDFWLRRIAIDHQLLQKEKTDTELMEQILINNLNQTEFFINKSIGRSLRDYSKT
ncbi:DNA alkylation repair protein, partial [Streptococcus suis]